MKIRRVRIIKELDGFFKLEVNRRWWPFWSKSFCSSYPTLEAARHAAKIILDNVIEEVPDSNPVLFESDRNHMKILRLKKGDILVVQVEDNISEDSFNTLKASITDTLKELQKNDVKVIFLEPGIALYNRKGGL